MSTVQIRRGIFHPSRNLPLPLPSRESARHRDYPSMTRSQTSQLQYRVVMSFLTCKPQLHGCLLQPHLSSPPATPPVGHHHTGSAAWRSTESRWACRRGVPSISLGLVIPPSSALHYLAYRCLPSTPPRPSEAPLSCRAVRNRSTHR